MAHDVFASLKRFKRQEFDHPEMMDTRVLTMLDAMVIEETRLKPGLKFIVHSDYRPGDPKEHGRGRAVDGHFEMHGFVLPVIEQFIMAARYQWSGIGLYPYWNYPGIHVDLMPLTLLARRRLWWKDDNGAYRRIEDYLIA